MFIATTTSCFQRSASAPTFSPVPLPFPPRSLRRRLSPGGQSDPRAHEQWLEALEQTAESPRAQAAVQSLKQVTRPGQPVSGVLLAANAVEDVWEELGR